ncbi:DsbA family oxidoreductase [Nocardia seriolae]|uniref:Protein dithiol-disulfide isomerase n=1 Tax=Nocardia seriolae TaxID=37332 RepID=A0A0B8NER0_9NOCA|nr:DsbA family oxidoreductase [Nocardia seriolae]MTJ62669.1 DsbA family oxidoreductase [Nocardia seriolae]MTJ73691.1 DsbA family oxidoreductase [Nocardia seriolae]MTJ89289.1 DsbA family oxidoreductase [Nocardia seriolae]MTK33267.1 DsbA family oxidoreductase [Nocardia seriolae]MTK40537.1 DsbA family oxidoreductase [Nocardia seriolae]
MAVQVEIWTDINCPFCYLGKRRFEEALTDFAHRDAVTVVHRSFELAPTLPHDHSDAVVPHIAEKYGISEAQAAANERGIGAQAEAMGLPYLTQGRDFGNSFDMHRLLHFALAQGKQEQLLDALYAANFAQEQPLFGDVDRLVQVAVAAGFDAAAVREVLDDPDAYADAVRADEAEAARLGARGVPFFVLDRKYGVSGAQPPEVFAQALERTWSDHAPELEFVADADAEACGPDGCALPQRN